jgi:hypothetical protein
MSNLIQTALTCGIPCVWTLFCLGGWALTRALFASEIYAERLPVDGFPTDVDRRRFWVDSMLDSRRRKIFKATLIWPAIFAGGWLVGFVVYTFVTSFKIEAI